MKQKKLRKSGCFLRLLLYLCIVINSSTEKNNLQTKKSIMFDFTLCNIVGYAAAVCMVLGYMPQAIYTIRTRDTDGIALPTFLLMGLGGFLFIIQGILTENWPLTVTNCITTASSMIVFGIKVYNDFFRK